MSKAIIIGAGIGGLCSALSLRQQGWEVTVFDKSIELKETGAGIVLAANAMRALEQLGVADQVRAVGSKIGAAEIRTWTGKLLVQLPAHKQAKIYGTYSYLIHRAELQLILRRAVEAHNSIQLQKQFVDYKETNGRVEAIFADGSTEDTDVLIGADGVYSAVRDRLFGQSAFRPSGYMAYRGVCAFEDESYPHEVGGGFEALGPGKRFGYSNLGNGRVFWFAAINVARNAIPPISERKAIVKKHFRGWYGPIEEVIEATEAEQILVHNILDRSPLKQWTLGRVTLLGDAAHPMLPNLGQGGAQAMEDAIVLSRCLKKNQDVRTALLEYEKERLARTAQIVNMSRNMGRVMQFENPVLILIRNQVLSRISEEFYIKRFDPIVGYRV